MQISLSDKKCRNNAQKCNSQEYNKYDIPVRDNKKAKIREGYERYTCEEGVQQR